MTTVGVAAVAALEMVGGGEDRIWTLVIEVLGAKLVALALGFLFSRWIFVEFYWLRHRLRLGPLLLFYSFPVSTVLDRGVPPPPYCLRVNTLESMVYGR